MPMEENAPAVKDTTLNSPFCSEEGGDEKEPSSPVKRATTTAIRRSEYISDVEIENHSKNDGSSTISCTVRTNHGVLHAIDSTKKRAPMHIWLDDSKLLTMAVDHMRIGSKDSYDTFEFTPFSSADNWMKMHPELKIAGHVRSKSNSPKTKLQQTQKLHRKEKANIVISNVLLLIFPMMILMAGILHFIVNIHGPKYAFSGEGEVILENCKMSTERLDDLIVDDSMTPQEAKLQTEKHGAAIVEDILTRETASHLREWTLKANKVLESTFVINSEHRHRITPSHKEPVVQAALKEIASHPTFRPLLDSVMGPSASLVAMSVITNLHGAEAQHFHPDTSSSSITHPDIFVTEYQLAIPLQDTTHDMGATAICPGTHKCEDLETGDEHYHKFMQEEYPDEKDYEILLDDEEFQEWLEYNYCDLSVEISAGSGLFYNTDLIHRGGGHSDPDAQQRAVLFITFAESRKGPDDNRLLPQGKVHSLKFDSWGHTVDDFESVSTEPWRLWHSLGLFLPSRRSSSGVTIRPWTLQDSFWHIFVTDDTAYVFSNALTQQYLEDMMGRVTVYLQQTAIFVVTVQLYFVLSRRWSS